jgi:hypothetical protein
MLALLILLQYVHLFLVPGDYNEVTNDMKPVEKFQYNSTLHEQNTRNTASYLSCKNKKGAAAATPPKLVYR